MVVIPPSTGAAEQGQACSLIDRLPSLTATSLTDAPISALNADGVAAIIACEGRYLLQHREERSGVAYPGWWGLFGGGREGSERAEQTLRRELWEELRIDVRTPRHIATVIYELASERKRTRKAFFGVDLPRSDLDLLDLREGQGMKWYDLREIFAIGERVIPYDLSFLSLHHSIGS